MVCISTPQATKKSYYLLTLDVMGHEGSTVIVVLNGLIQLMLWPEIARRREKA